MVSAQNKAPRPRWLLAWWMLPVSVIVVVALLCTGWVGYRSWEKQRIAEAYEQVMLPPSFSLVSKRWSEGLDGLQAQNGWHYRYLYQGDDARHELTVALERAGYRMLPQNFWEGFRARNDTRWISVVADFYSSPNDGGPDDSGVLVAVNRPSG